MCCFLVFVYYFITKTIDSHAGVDTWFIVKLKVFFSIILTFSHTRLTGIAHPLFDVKSRARVVMCDDHDTLPVKTANPLHLTSTDVDWWVSLLSSS